ncbi:unnamed protein product, partial [Chrysoparadoxa australica]
MKVAVCVVGQLGRLQLESLIENFIIPNRREGNTVDVVVRLADTVLSVNDKDLREGSWADSSADDVAKYL